MLRTSTTLASFEIDGNDDPEITVYHFEDDERGPYVILSVMNDFSRDGHASLRLLIPEIFIEEIVDKLREAFDTTPRKQRKGD